MHQDYATEINSLFDGKLMHYCICLSNLLARTSRISSTKFDGEWACNLALISSKSANWHKQYPEFFEGISWQWCVLNLIELCSESQRLIGVPVITSTQASQRGHYQILMGISTFLSGVTASMLQITNDNNNNLWQIATNALFLSSMVFSIGSTVSSILSLTWTSSFMWVVLV